MPTTERFWKYAKEAILSAYEAKTDEDKQALLDLACTWTQAALVEQHTLADHGKSNRGIKTASVDGFLRFNDFHPQVCRREQAL